MLEKLPPQDHAISKTMADQLKQAYKARNENRTNLTFAHHFHASQVRQILDKHDTKTFTVSMGYNPEENREVVILEGFDSNGKSQEIFLEMSMPCPPYCDDAPATYEAPTTPGEEG